jgi:isochorismate synthase
LFKADEHFWMGATPEPFARLKDNVFQTSSVAGTRENTEEFQEFENWQNKEREEQQFVSDHIRRTLKTANWTNITHQGPYVKKAGNMVHLRTDFTTNINEVNGNIGYLLERLHPTPAVCGYQTKEALGIIESIEKHDREYYSGFLGPVGLENAISLFVNLRCMRISKSFLSLFTGAGITIDSIPDEEWKETEMKSRTLLSAINTMN